MMSQGFFLAMRQDDGSPGNTVGNDLGATMVFEDVAAAAAARESLRESYGKLAIFCINIVVVGEVLA